MYRIFHKLVDLIGPAFCWRLSRCQSFILQNIPSAWPQPYPNFSTQPYNQICNLIITRNIIIFCIISHLNILYTPTHTDIYIFIYMYIYICINMFIYNTLLFIIDRFGYGLIGQTNIKSQMP